MRSRGISQGKALADYDFQAAADGLKERARAVLELNAGGDIVDQRRPRYVERALVRELQDVERLRLAGSVAEADQHAAPLEAVERSRERRFADRVVNDGDAAPGRELTNPRGKVFSAINDRFMAAMAPSELGLFVRAHAAEHARAERV